MGFILSEVRAAVPTGEVDVRLPVWLAGGEIPIFGTDIHSVIQVTAQPRKAMIREHSFRLGIRKMESVNDDIMRIQNRRGYSESPTHVGKHSQSGARRALEHKIGQERDVQ